MDNRYIGNNICMAGVNFVMASVNFHTGETGWGYVFTVLGVIFLGLIVAGLISDRRGRK